MYMYIHVYVCGYRMYGEEEDDYKIWRKDDRKRREYKHPNSRQKVLHMIITVVHTESIYCSNMYVCVQDYGPYM